MTKKIIIFFNAVARKMKKFDQVLRKLLQYAFLTQLWPSDTLYMQSNFFRFPSSRNYRCNVLGCCSETLDLIQLE